MKRSQCYKLPVFDPLEMVNIYRQALNKKRQIEIFSECNCKTKEEIIEILVANGVRREELPRGPRKDKGEKRLKRPVEDEVIEAILEEEPVEEQPEPEEIAAPAAPAPEISQIPGVAEVIEYIHRLKNERDRLNAELSAVNDLLSAILQEVIG